MIKFPSIRANDFLRNVIVVAGGSAISQAISIAFSPIITRLYGPEALGIVGLFIAVTSILIVISSACYSQAIILPKLKTDGVHIYRLCFIITAYFSLIVALVTFFCGEQLLQFLHLAQVKTYSLLIPISVCLGGCAQTMDQWLGREQQFKVSSVTQIARVIIDNGAKVLIGITAPIASVLIIVTSISSAIQLAFYYSFFQKIFPKIGRSGLCLNSEVRAVACRYRDFPIYGAPQVLLNAVSQGLPIILLSTFFGPSAAGYYAISERVLRAPLWLISTSVGRVFLPAVVAATQSGTNPRRMTVKATLILAGIGLGPFGIIMVFGRAIFSFGFGAEWSRAGDYAAWLSIWLYFGFMNIPSVQTLTVMGYRKYLLGWELVTTSIKIFLLYYVGVFLKDDMLAIKIYSIFGAAAYAQLIWVGVSAQVSNRDYTGFKPETLKK